MALLWLDGFDGMNTDGGGADDYIRRRYATGMDPSWNAAVGQHGVGHSLAGSYNHLHTPQWDSVDRILYIGLAFMCWGYTNNSWIFELLQPPGPGVSEDVVTSIGFTYLAYDQEIRVTRNGATVWTTSTGGAITFGHWHWLEFRVYCDNTNGEVEIKCGGKTILFETGDTQARSTVNYHNGLYISNHHTRNLRWDNLYICDSTGTKNNTFLGPVRVTTISPAGDGDESDWTPQTGLDHSVMVDEMPQIDTDDYVDSISVGDKDLWEYDDVANIGDTIYAVQVLTDAQSIEGSPIRLKTLVKTGATETVDDGLPLKANNMAIPRLMEVQPGGLGDWTESTLNAYQFGVEHAEV